MTNWICPNCQEPLEKSGGSLVCVSGHGFDVAKEGYVNLLTGKQKSGTKGDTPEMLAARRRFLGGGYYEPLRQKLVQKVQKMNPKVVAEIGCGEGYYIGGVAEHISSTKCLATDIAKDGVRLGAKAYPGVAFAVADTNRFLPIGDGAVDVVLDVFAPRNAAEFARVLSDEGRLLVVIPTPSHLAELRKIYPLLAIQNDKRRAVEEGLSEQFSLVSAEVLTVPLQLSGFVISDLIGMTPNAWFLNDAAKATLAAVNETRVTAEFEILEFRVI